MGANPCDNFNKDWSRAGATNKRSCFCPFPLIVGKKLDTSKYHGNYGDWIGDRRQCTEQANNMFNYILLTVIAVRVNTGHQIDLHMIASSISTYQSYAYLLKICQPITNVSWCISNAIVSLCLLVWRFLVIVGSIIAPLPNRSIPTTCLGGKSACFTKSSSWE